MAASLFNIIANLVTRLDADPKGFLDDMKKTFDDATNIVTKFASAGAEAIKGTFSASDLGKFISEIGNISGLDKAFTAPLETTKAAVSSMRQYVTKEFSALWDNPVDYATQRIKSFGESATKVFSDTFNETSFEKFAEGIYDTFTRLPEIFSNIREGDFSAAFESVRQEAEKLLASFDDPNAQENTMFTRLKTGVLDFKQAITNLGRSTLSELGVMDKIDAALKKTGESWKSVTDPDVGPITNVRNLLEDAVGSFGDQFAQQIDKMAAGEDAAATVAQYMRGLINAGKDLYTALQPAYAIMNSVSGALGDVAQAGATTIKEIVKAPDLFSRTVAAAKGLANITGTALRGGLDVARTAISGLGAFLSTTTGLMVAATAATLAFAAGLATSFTAGIAQASALNEAVRKLDGTMQSLGRDGGSIDEVRASIQRWAGTSSASIQEISAAYQNLLLLFGDSTTPDAIVELASRISATDANKSLTEMTQLISKLASGSDLTAQEMRRLGITFEDMAAAGFNNTKIIEDLTDKYSDYASRLDDTNKVSRAFAEFSTESEKLFGPLAEAARKLGIEVGSMVVNVGTSLVKLTNTFVLPAVERIGSAVTQAYDIISEVNMIPDRIVEYIGDSRIGQVIGEFANIIRSGVINPVTWISDAFSDTSTLGRIAAFWTGFNNKTAEGVEKQAELAEDQNQNMARSLEQIRAQRRQELEEQAKYNNSSLAAQESYVNNFLANIFKSGAALDEDIKFTRDYYNRRSNLISTASNALAAQEAATGEVLLSERIRINNEALTITRKAYEAELEIARQTAAKRKDVVDLPPEERQARINQIISEDENLAARRLQLDAAYANTALKNRQSFYEKLRQAEELASAQLGIASAFSPPQTGELESYYATRKRLLQDQIAAAGKNQQEQAQLTAQFVQLQAEELRAVRDNATARAELTAEVISVRLEAERSLSGEVIDLAGEQFAARRDALEKSIAGTRAFKEEYLKLVTDAYRGSIAEVERARNAHINAYGEMTETSRAFLEFEQSYRGQSAAEQLALLDEQLEAQRNIVKTSQGNAEREKAALLSQVAISRDRLAVTKSTVDQLTELQSTLVRQSGELDELFARTSIERTETNIATLQADYKLAADRLKISRLSGEERLRAEQDLNNRRLRLISAASEQANDLFSRALGGEFDQLALAKSQMAFNMFSNMLDNIRDQVEEGTITTTAEAAAEFGKFMNSESYQALRSQLTPEALERLNAEFRDATLRLNEVNSDIIDSASASLEAQSDQLSDADSRTLQLTKEQDDLIKSTLSLRERMDELDVALLTVTGNSLEAAQRLAQTDEERVQVAEQQRTVRPEGFDNLIAAMEERTISIRDAVEEATAQRFGAPIPPLEMLATLSAQDLERLNESFREATAGLELAAPPTAEPAAPTPPPAPPAPAAAPPAQVQKPEPVAEPAALPEPTTDIRRTAAVLENALKQTDEAGIAKPTLEPPAGGGALDKLSRALTKVADAINNIAQVDIFTPQTLERIMLGLAVELKKEAL